MALELSFHIPCLLALNVQLPLSVVLCLPVNATMPSSEKKPITDSWCKEVPPVLVWPQVTLVMDHKHLTAVLEAMRRAYHHLQLLDCSIGLYFFLSAYQYEIQSSYADGFSHLPLSDRKELSVMSQVCSTLSNSQ